MFVRPHLEECTRNLRGRSLITLPAQSLYTPPSPKAMHLSRADLRETSLLQRTHLGVVWRHQFGGSFWPDEGSNPSSARATRTLLRCRGPQAHAQQVPFPPKLSHPAGYHVHTGVNGTVCLSSLFVPVYSLPARVFVAITADAVHAVTNH